MNVSTNDLAQKESDSPLLRLPREVCCIQSTCTSTELTNSIGPRQDLLPGAYMEELKMILAVPTSKLGAVAKKKRETEEAERKKRQEQDNESGFHAFMKTMVDKFKGTPSENTYRDMLKAPAKSPAVMADLFKPPTKEELERYSREYPGDEATGGGGGFVEEEEDIDVESEGISMIDGKPVLGPPRPPGLL